MSFLKFVLTVLARWRLGATIGAEQILLVEEGLTDAAFGEEVGQRSRSEIRGQATEGSMEVGENDNN
jgi:hypothetical protein